MLLAAAIVLSLLGFLHSVLGEWFVFRTLRMDALPELGFPPVVGVQSSGFTIRVCWHLLSVFGWLIAYLVIDGHAPIRPIAIALLVCAVLVAIATRGRHLGWVGFLAGGVLCWLGA